MHSLQKKLQLGFKAIVQETIKALRYNPRA